MRKPYDIWQLLPKSIRTKAADRHRGFSIRLKYLFWRMTHWKKPEYHSVPVIINNYNRVTYLQQLISSLEKRGYRNIHILDNQSDYPPLLEWYETCPYEVIRLDKNYGFKAIWDSGVYNRFKHSFYVYTDSDVVLDEECPEDFMKVFMDILDRYPDCLKVGFGIHIDDLPDHFRMKDEVIRVESRFWKDELEEGVYLAQIDTTFALYRPYCYGPANNHHMMIRTGSPYMIRHLPWYIDQDHLSDEESYYINHTTQSTHWTKKAK